VVSGRGGLWPVASGSGGGVGLDARGADMAWTARQWAAVARGGRATVEVEAEPSDVMRRAGAGMADVGQAMGIGPVGGG
jgi:hypothetical protein